MLHPAAAATAAATCVPELLPEAGKGLVLAAQLSSEV